MSVSSFTGAILIIYISPGRRKSKKTIPNVASEVSGIWYLGVSSPLRRLTCNNTPRSRSAAWLVPASAGWQVHSMMSSIQMIRGRPLGRKNVQTSRLQPPDFNLQTSSPIHSPGTSTNPTLKTSSKESSKGSTTNFKLPLKDYSHKGSGRTSAKQRRE